MAKRGRPPSKVCNRRETKPSRFFKIILPSVLEQKRLRIPEKFARKFSFETSVVATLTVSTGAAWKVAISRHENKLYFTEGWADFMEHNRIRYGYFLDFEYMRNRHFNVYIFDLSCCEIDYPSNNTHNSSTEYDHQAKECPSEKLVQVKEEEDEAVHSSSGLHEIKCNKSPSFDIVVRTCQAHYLHVPQSFSNLHMMGKSNICVKLQVDDERQWCIPCYQLRKSFRLTGAEWKKFRNENNWHLGENYVFKLVGEESNDLVFKVCKP